MMRWWRTNGTLILFTVVCLAAIVTFWWTQARIEARTYNRLTGWDVTTWEAMWTNLRVDCS